MAKAYSDLLLHEFRYSYEADPPGQVFGFLQSSNNNFLKNVMLFTPCLIRQSRGSALLDYLQPVLKFHLLIRGQRRNVHEFPPFSGFRVFGVTPKNSNPKFIGKL